MKHLGNPFIDDLTEITGITLKNVSAFVKSSGWKKCWSAKHRLKHISYGTLEKEKKRDHAVSQWTH